jgi:predicted exporter
MLLLLWTSLGALILALANLIPIGLAIMTTVGVLHLNGEILNLFDLIWRMLILGIGLIYSRFSAVMINSRVMH